MAKGWLVIKCPGCQTSDRRIIKLPSENGKTQEHFTCSVCGSGLKAVIVKKPDENPNAVNVTTSVVRPSKLLLDMLEEEKQQKEASDGREKQEDESKEVQTQDGQGQEEVTA